MAYDEKTYDGNGWIVLKFNSLFQEAVRMEWKEYIDLVISSQTTLDGISLCFNNTRTFLSPIIKASILMLEDMIAFMGKKNIFVFPDITQLSREFLIAKVIYNITSGKIKMLYDPYRFEQGQKLRYMNCIVEFDGCETDLNNTERIYFRVKEGNRIGVPVSKAPFFQVVESKRLSTYSAYNKAKKLKEKNQNETLKKLEDHMTHLSSSIFYVSEIKNTRDFLMGATLNGKKVSDVLFIAHANGNGEITNLSSGQMSGNPAVIIACDLYSVNNAIKNGAIVQSIIFDASQPNALEKQLDAFDILSHYDLPVVCITNTANSFDNRLLKERGYNEWRWDKDSLTESLYMRNGIKLASTRVKNCARQIINYYYTDGLEVSEAINLLYKHKAEIDEQSSTLIAIYEKLFSLVFNALRNIIPIGVVDQMHFAETLADCSIKLEKEKKYISKDLYDDLALAIMNLQIVIDSNYTNGKHLAITDILKSRNYNSACIVISDRQDKTANKRYWIDWCEKNECCTQIAIMYPQEYLGMSGICFDVTIVVSWFSNKIMRNIIYHFDSKEYIVLLYKYEERWKKSHTGIWRRQLDNSNNERIVQKSFSHSKRKIRFATSEQHNDITDYIESTTDELADIEQLLLSNKYRRYNSSGNDTAEVVNAYPVCFVGGLLAFYRSGHKVITVTDIIQQTGNHIHAKLPESLVVGDFVVIREAQRDIIRELADSILSKEGKSGLRDFSHKWKESLEVEFMYSSCDEIYQKLKKAGCKKDYVTVKNWLMNEELIIPQDQEDLLNIAIALNDEILLDKADLIYAAGREVRSAHTRAGRILSEKLKNKIADEIQEMNELDPLNIWDPITLQLEDIGNVKILKVIDIGQMVPIEACNTNRLLTE